MVGPGSKHPGYPELWVALIKHLAPECKGGRPLPTRPKHSRSQELPAFRPAHNLRPFKG